MDVKISSGLKILFLVHFIVALIFGLGFLLIPGQFFGLFKVPILEHIPYRLIGAAMLAFGASSWLGYKAEMWEQVKIVVQAEIVWAVLGSLVLLYGLLFAGQPVVEWINFAILAGFAAAFIYYYAKK